MRLSDAFIGKPAGTGLELEVTVYNIAEGNNTELLEHSKALSDYAAFLSCVEEMMQEDHSRFS